MANGVESRHGAQRVLKALVAVGGYALLTGLRMTRRRKAGLTARVSTHVKNLTGKSKAAAAASTASTTAIARKGGIRGADCRRKIQGCGVYEAL